MWLALQIWPARKVANFGRKRPSSITLVRKVFMSDKPDSRLLRFQVIEVSSYVALALLCFALSWLICGTDSVERYSLVALLVCWVSSIGPVLWQIKVSTLATSDISILLTMGFRFSLLLGAVAISTATKWQHHNSFCNCLLGYYFPFLLLQSAFLIRQQSIPNPPQS